MCGDGDNYIGLAGIGEILRLPFPFSQLSIMLLGATGCDRKEKAMKSCVLLKAYLRTANMALQF
jgi:hypothetical protein